MDAIALAVLVVGGCWLAAVGVFMAWRPQAALDVLSLTASSHRINLTEQGLRFLAGLALALRSDLSKLPQLFEVSGWFVMITSILLMVMPLRIHAGYAIWWSKHLPRGLIRMIAPLSIAAGAGLIYASI